MNLFLDCKILIFISQTWERQKKRPNNNNNNNNNSDSSLTTLLTTEVKIVESWPEVNWSFSSVFTHVCKIMNDEFLTEHARICRASMRRRPPIHPHTYASSTLRNFMHTSDRLYNNRKPDQTCNILHCVYSIHCSSNFHFTIFHNDNIMCKRFPVL